MILSLSAPMEDLPINLRLLGISHRQEPINRPAGLALYQWFLCVKGKGEFISDHQRSVVSEGQGLLIYPDIPHIYRSLSEDWTVHFAGFDGPVCSSLLHSLSMVSSGVYHIPHPDIFKNAIERFYRIYVSGNPSSKGESLSVECYRFLLGLSRDIKYLSPSELVPENETLRIALDYLEKNFSRPVTLTDLSDITGLAKEYLCSVFKKEMDQTIMHYLLMLRISHAKIYLIQYPDKKVTEISKMCGFESPSYFGKLFRREVGMTPEQYRKEH